MLWKLTNGEVFATDYSCASATGMFDPFQASIFDFRPIVCYLNILHVTIINKKYPVHTFDFVDVK